MKSRIKRLCTKMNLGELKNDPAIVTGGLLHTMYRVSTDRGEYAIKQLNSSIMQKSGALQNMVNSEIIAMELRKIIPLITAKRFNGEYVTELDGIHYMAYDWLDGNAIFAPDISNDHCGQIGMILGKIHASDIHVDNLKTNIRIRKPYEWNMILEKAQRQSTECYEILKENLESVTRWDNGVVNCWNEVKTRQVISHRDLDPKNVLWKDGQPYIIDWEAAGYVNAAQELVEVIHYWIADETGMYSYEKFERLMRAYTAIMDISGINWDAVLNCSFNSMLGWLVYNVKRVLGMDGEDLKAQQDGLQQVMGTLHELKRHEAQIDLLRDWIGDYNGTIGVV